MRYSLRAIFSSHRLLFKEHYLIHLFHRLILFNSFSFALCQWIVEPRLFSVGGLQFHRINQRLFCRPNYTNICQKICFCFAAIASLKFVVCFRNCWPNTSTSGRCFFLPQLIITWTLTTNLFEQEFVTMLLISRHSIRKFLSTYNINIQIFCLFKIYYITFKASLIFCLLENFEVYLIKNMIRK